MKEISVIDSPALYRDNYRVRGFVFGSGKKSVCVVGPMRGNEYQQQFIAARLVSRLKEIESKGELVDGYEILVLPCANTYSFNTRKRFWPINNFDINRSFPGEVDGANRALCRKNSSNDKKLPIRHPAFFILHQRNFHAAHKNIQDGIELRAKRQGF